MRGNPLRRAAFVVGLLFVITFVASIPAAVALYTRCWPTPTTSSVPVLITASPSEPSSR